MSLEGTAPGTLPSGTVALLFADLEGSTLLLQRLGEAYAGVLSGFRGILDDQLAAHGGQLVDVAGEGVFAVFRLTTDAARCAIAAQKALAARGWPAGVSVRARIGIHTGEPTLTQMGYVGLDVHRAARIAAAGHGGQIVLSATSHGLIRRAALGQCEIADLGLHRVRDLSQPERLFQLTTPGLASVFPPLRTEESYAAILPCSPTPILGRAQELAQLRELLARDSVRFVTITGPGGVGKTRLALELADRSRDAFAGGVFFMDCSAVPADGELLAKLSECLGLHPGPSLEQDLENFFQNRSALVVLDQLESHVAQGGRLIALLSRCPGLKLVATSRIPLRRRGEQEFALRPLPVPQPSIDPEALASFSAVELFLTRARAVSPALELTPENAAAIGEITRRLEGLPLAIELAAARIKMFSPEDLAQRLERPLDVLTRGPEDLPPRQRTLRDAIGWSYRLLSVEQRRLLRVVAVFAGGGTLEALAGLWPRVGGDPQANVTELVATLLDHNLLVRVERENAVVRFAMLDTIREFAREEIERLRETLLHDEHLELYGAMARGVAHSVDVADLHRLESELDNIRSAISFALAGPETAVRGLEMATALTRFWWRRRPSEGYDWLARALERAPAAAPSLRAQALASLGFLAYYTGHAHEVVARAREALAICPDEDRSARALALGMLALGTSAQGSHSEARKAIDESVQILRASEDALPLGVALGWQGFIAVSRGDEEAARDAWTEDVELFRSLGERWLIASPIAALGELAFRRGDYRAARAHAEESLALLRAAGQASATARAPADLGRISEAEGKPREADICYREGLLLARDLGNPRSGSAALAGAAAWCARRGKVEDAARLLGTLEALSLAGQPMDVWWRQELTDCARQLRESLGEREFEERKAAGASLVGESVLGAAIEALSDVG